MMRRVNHGEEEEEDDEPVLKYRRFAKEVVTSICEGSDGGRNIICCMAVHPKVLHSTGPGTVGKAKVCINWN